MHREKPHKLLQVGVTPTPATTAGAGPTLVSWYLIMRKHLAAPVSKTGSDFHGNQSITDAFCQLTTINQSYDHQPPIAKVAGAKICQTTTTGGNSPADEAAAGSADTA